MKRWKIGFLACLVSICLGATLVSCQSGTYTPEGKDQTLSSSALGKSGTLRVGVNASSAPLAGQTSSTSHIVGIDVDVAAYLADQLGLKVEVVDVGNDPVSAIGDGDVDVVLGVDASTENEADYWRSKAYLDTGVALFGSEGETSVPTTDSHPKVAAQGSSKSSWRVTNMFGDDSLVSQSDLKSAFEALQSDAVRYVAADAVIGTYVSHSNDYPAKIVALLQEPSGYCAAVAESNTELQSAVESALTGMVNGGVMDVIEDKWLGTAINLGDVTVVKAPMAEAPAPAAAEPAAAEGAVDAGGAENADEPSAEEAAEEEPVADADADADEDAEVA